MSRRQIGPIHFVWTTAPIALFLLLMFILVLFPETSPGAVGFYLVVMQGGQILITAGIGLQIMRWFFENVGLEHGALGLHGRLGFNGEYWPYVGWTVLLVVSLWAGSVSAESPQVHYMLHCQGCHLADGRGVPGKIPGLSEMGSFLTVPGGRAYLVQVPGTAQAPLNTLSGR